MIFSEIADINPKVKLSRGEEYSFIEMSDITPGNRYVKAEKNKIFKGGGSKFESDDVLFARITPCLENGKIAQFKGVSAIAGFGSTEFFVFRAKKGVSDKGFLYYLAFSAVLRKPAEGSMFGASGRQRAVLDVVKSTEIPNILLTNQRKISAILSTYDDFIENNTRRIQILEEMAQRIYREWFVDFRFPGHEKMKFTKSDRGRIPEGWTVKRLGDVIELAYGKALKSEDRLNGEVPVYGSSGIVGYHNQHLVEGPGIIVGRKGNVGSVFWSDINFYPIDTVFYVLTELNSAYIFYHLQGMNFINNDAAVPGLNRNQAYSLLCLVPNKQVLDHFQAMIMPIMRQKRLLTLRIDNLRQSRDMLLPKLISGEIDVLGIDISGSRVSKFD